MKTTIIKITVAAMIAGSAAAAMYPPQEGDLVASIPFSFQVGTKVMAAGEYMVRAHSDGTIEVCEDGVYCTTLQAAPSALHGNIRILFAGIGDQHQMIGLLSGPEESLSGQQTAVPTRPLHIDRCAGTNLTPTWH